MELFRINKSNLLRLGECSTTSDIVSENCSISEVASSVTSHKSEEKYSVFDIGDNMLDEYGITAF